MGHPIDFQMFWSKPYLVGNPFLIMKNREKVVPRLQEWMRITDDQHSLCYYLVGGWTNPLKKNMRVRQIGSFPQFSGWKFPKIVGNPPSYAVMFFPLTPPGLKLISSIQDRFPFPGVSKRALLRSFRKGKGSIQIPFQGSLRKVATKKKHRTKTFKITFLAKSSYFTNLDFPEIKGFFPFRKATFWGEVVWGRYNLTRPLTHQIEKKIGFKEPKKKRERTTNSFWKKT